jgi:hypothetical protein
MDITKEIWKGGRQEKEKLILYAKETQYKVEIIEVRNLMLKKK